jgi:hypothetical protein
LEVQIKAAVARPAFDDSDADRNLVERIIFELYNSSLYWILRERMPPHDINEDCEWSTVRMAAKIFRAIAARGRRRPN